MRFLSPQKLGNAWFQPKNKYEFIVLELLIQELSAELKASLIQDNTYNADETQFVINMDYH